MKHGKHHSTGATPPFIKTKSEREQIELKAAMAKAEAAEVKTRAERFELEPPGMQKQRRPIRL